LCACLYSVAVSPGEARSSDGSLFWANIQPLIVRCPESQIHCQTELSRGQLIHLYYDLGYWLPTMHDHHKAGLVCLTQGLLGLLRKKKRRKGVTETVLIQFSRTSLQNLWDNSHYDGSSNHFASRVFILSRKSDLSTKYWTLKLFSSTPSLLIKRTVGTPLTP
jgi:hypothetical protein